MDLLRHARHVLADQFQVQKVDADLLCAIGPFPLGDGQYVEVYLRDDEPGLEMIFYPGLTEVLTLEAMHEARGDEGQGAALFAGRGLELHEDRLSRRSSRETLLDDLVEFNRAVQALDRFLRTAGLNP